MIALTLFQSLTNPRGKLVSWSFDQFVDYTRAPIVAENAARGGLGGFSAATFADDYRKKENVERVTLLTLDIDKLAMQPRELHELCNSIEHVVYTTSSHEPHAPRVRLAMTVSRAITRDEFPKVRRAVVAQFATVNVEPDPNAPDCSRFFFAPTVRPGHESAHEVHTIKGDALDIDRLIEIATELEEFEARERAKRLLAKTSGRVIHKDAYIEAALRNAADTVASAPVGTRNATLNKQTFKIARFPIDESLIFFVMLDAALSCGLPRGEAERTIQSAINGQRRGRAS